MDDERHPFELHTLMFRVLCVTGTLDGGISVVSLVSTEPYEEAKVQVDDTVYTFDTSLQAVLLGGSYAA
mgnify:CR=1 FL=1